MIAGYLIDHGGTYELRLEGELSQSGQAFSKWFCWLKDARKYGTENGITIDRCHED